ncbi:hypothetical protein B0H17DRAFT_1142867 [Mycena rosella]|uniref:Uncharacterized protein n=1 Tax=Mycena rosella TaxID=1033263 RepID=A0AAD7G8Z0_MYCRO|nr:hypothetical protein B0H17DRAFT_1142867 [Mycena rosella]
MHPRERRHPDDAHTHPVSSSTCLSSFFSRVESLHKIPGPILGATYSWMSTQNSSQAMSRICKLPLELQEILSMQLHNSEARKRRGVWGVRVITIFSEWRCSSAQEGNFSGSEIQRPPCDMGLSTIKSVSHQQPESRRTPTMQLDAGGKKNL